LRFGPPSQPGEIQGVGEMKKISPSTKLNLFWVGALLFFLFQPGEGTTLAVAQVGAGGWGAPVNLSNSETVSSTPSIAVDPAGGVHVVWSEETEDERAFIRYATLQDGAWSAANEIVSSPYYQVADYPSLAADSQGYLHLVWRGDATLYYSRAYAPLAGSALNWSRPQALEDVQDFIGAPDLVVDGQDRLYLIYPINLGGRSGIYAMQSTDGGRTWSDPAVVYRNSRSNRMVDDVHLAVDADGGKHAAWVESNYPETFPPIGIRYSQALADEQGWSEAQSLADGPYGDPEILARGSAEVHVVYSGTAEDRYKFHRWSSDSGRNWTESWRNSEVGGFQGYAGLALDGSDRIHWLMAASVLNVRRDALFHTSWNGESWSAGEAPLFNVSTKSNPMDVTAVVGLGNQLHVALMYPLEAPGLPDGNNEIYYIGRALGAVPTPARQLATITPRPTQPATATARLIETSQPTLAARIGQASSISDSLILAIGGGMLLALLLVSGVILLARRKS
jgi:hypothetical protein